MAKITKKLSRAEKRAIYAAREDVVINLHSRITEAEFTKGKPALVERFMRQGGFWLFAVRCGCIEEARGQFTPLFKTATELQQAIAAGEVKLISKEV